jgi:hypothetical protein
MGGKIAVEGMPRSIKERLIRAAEACDGNINDIAVAAVAAKFGVPFTPSGKRSPTPPGPDGNMLLSMPMRLQQKVKTTAVNNHIRFQDVIIAILAEADF